MLFIDVQIKRQGGKMARWQDGKEARWQLPFSPLALLPLNPLTTFALIIGQHNFSQH